MNKDIIHVSSLGKTLCGAPATPGSFVSPEVDAHLSTCKACVDAWYEREDRAVVAQAAQDLEATKKENIQKLALAVIEIIHNPETPKELYNAVVEAKNELENETQVHDHPDVIRAWLPQVIAKLEEQERAKRDRMDHG